MFKQEEGMFHRKSKGEGKILKKYQKFKSNWAGIWKDNTNILLRNKMSMIANNPREKTYNV